jgi:hypothetical protein
MYPLRCLSRRQDSSRPSTTVGYCDCLAQLQGVPRFARPATLAESRKCRGARAEAAVGQHRHAAALQTA